VSNVVTLSGMNDSQRIEALSEVAKTAKALARAQESRDAAILAALDADWSVAEVARAAKVTRPTIYRIVNRTKGEGDNAR
jgi:transcriptional regulator of acetoin/glycerol metabolism